MNAPPITTRSGGFSLVEVIVAIGILAMILLTVAGVSVRSQRANNDAAGQTGATQLLTALSSNIQQGRGKYTPPAPSAGAESIYELSREDITDLFANQTKNDYGNTDLYSARVMNLGQASVGGMTVVRYSVTACYVSMMAASGDKSCMVQSMYGPPPSVTRTPNGTSTSGGGDNSYAPPGSTNPGPRGDVTVTITDAGSREAAPTVTISGPENFQRTLRSYTTGYTLSRLPAGTYRVNAEPSTSKQSVNVSPASTFVVRENDTTNLKVTATRARARVTFGYVPGEKITTNIEVTTGSGDRFIMECDIHCDQTRFLDVGDTYTLRSLNERQRLKIDEYNAPMTFTVRNTLNVNHRLEVRTYDSPVTVSPRCYYNGELVPCRQEVVTRVGQTVFYTTTDAVYNAKPSMTYEVNFNTKETVASAGRTLYVSEQTFPIIREVEDGGSRVDLRFDAYYNNAVVNFSKTFPENMPAYDIPARIGYAETNATTTGSLVMTAVPGIKVSVPAFQSPEFTVQNRKYRYQTAAAELTIGTNSAPLTVPVNRYQYLPEQGWFLDNTPLSQINQPPPTPDPEPEPEPEPEPPPPWGGTDPGNPSDPGARVGTVTLACIHKDFNGMNDGRFDCVYTVTSGPSSQTIVVQTDEIQMVTVMAGEVHIEGQLREIMSPSWWSEKVLVFDSFQNIGRQTVAPNGQVNSWLAGRYTKSADGTCCDNPYDPPEQPGGPVESY